MAETFKFELVSPERILMSEDAEQVLVPGSEGDFTVFPEHAPVITTLRPGVLDVKMPEGNKSIFVRSGFAEVTAQSVTVLAESAFVVGEVESQVIEDQLKSARDALEGAEGDDEIRFATRAVEELELLQGHSA